VGGAVQRARAVATVQKPQANGPARLRPGSTLGGGPEFESPHPAGSHRVPPDGRQGQLLGVLDLRVEPLPRSVAVPPFDPDSAASKASTRTKAAGHWLCVAVRFTRSGSVKAMVLGSRPSHEATAGHRPLRAAGPLPRRARAAPGRRAHFTNCPGLQSGRTADHDPSSFHPAGTKTFENRAVLGPGRPQPSRGRAAAQPSSRGRLRAVQGRGKGTQIRVMRVASIQVRALIERTFVAYNDEAVGSSPATPTVAGLTCASTAPDTTVDRRGTPHNG
jgi:hypothetical protein